MKVNVSIGIIDGESKRGIEDYFDARLFRQRKSFDEYYLDSSVLEMNLDIDDLCILSEHVKVEVHNGEIYLEDKN